MTDLEKLVAEISNQPPKNGDYSIVVRLAAGLILGVAGAVFIQTAFGSIVAPEGELTAFRPSFVKIAYSTALAAAAAVLVLQVAAPETKLGRQHLLVLAPVMMMAMIAMTELFTSPMEDWLHLMTGFDITSCLSMILITAPPIYVGLVWSFRRFAPANLKVAGAAIGALSGATAGAIYAALSGHASVCFVFIWFSCAIAITTLAGAIAGRFLLRW